MTASKIGLISFFMMVSTAAAYAGLGPCVLTPDQIDTMTSTIACSQNLGCAGGIFVSPPSKICDGGNYDCPEFQVPAVMFFPAMEVPAFYGVGACSDPETGETWNCVPDFTAPTYGAPVTMCY